MRGLASIMVPKGACALQSRTNDQMLPNDRNVLRGEAQILSEVAFYTAILVF